MEFAQHTRVGICFGLGALALGAQAVGITWAADVLLAPAVVAGAASWPDGDHHSSTITRAFPPITWPMHMALVWLDRVVYTLTRRCSDPPAWDGYRRTGRFRTWLSNFLPEYLWWAIGIPRRWDSSHRRLTHGIPFALTIGVLVGVICAAVPWYASAVLFVTTVCLAGDLVFAGPVLGIYLLAGVVHFGVPGFAEHIQLMGPLWGACVALGMVSHDFADGCTTYGNPYFAPFTWQRFHSPLPFDTGSFFERVIVKWLLILLMIYLGWVVALQWLPSVFPQGIPILSDLLHGLVNLVHGG